MVLRRYPPLEEFTNPDVDSLEDFELEVWLEAPDQQCEQFVSDGGSMVDKAEGVTVENGQVLRQDDLWDSVLWYQ